MSAPVKHLPQGITTSYGKKGALFTVSAVSYYETLAVTSIRRLWALRLDPLARSSIRGWVGTLRDAARVRAYRGVLGSELSAESVTSNLLP